MYEGDAYWVHPDQVSKTPESGEYLSRGGFIIRGKRNYYANLPLDLSVGLYHSREVMAGPTPAVVKNCEVSMGLEPGGLEKNEAVKQVADTFTEKAGKIARLREEISRVLPPGKSQIKKIRLEEV